LHACHFVDHVLHRRTLPIVANQLSVELDHDEKIMHIVLSATSPSPQKRMK
jgi:hypothetical protein